MAIHVPVAQAFAGGHRRLVEQEVVSPLLSQKVARNRWGGGKVKDAI